MKVLYEGMPLDDSVRAVLSALDPAGQISVSCGRHYETEEDFLYLVRLSSRPVAVPRMAYGAEISRAFSETYGKEERLGGETDLSQARGNHS